MRLLTANAALDCTAIAKPDLVNPAIVAKTGRDLLNLQEEQLELWLDYLYQRVLKQVNGEIIVSVIPKQYIKPLYKQYLGYNGVTINQFLQKICTWFVITNNDKLKVETYFAAPWTDTPNAHTSKYAAQLNERQLKCVDFNVLISDATKTILFVGQMDKSGPFEPKFIDNYDDTPEKRWTTVVELSSKQYDREMRRIKREGENKDYKIMTALREINRGGAPQPQPEADMATREYIAAMEERSTMQDAHIKDLMERGPPTTIPATDGAAAAIVITRGSNRSSSTTGQQLTELQSAFATITTTVSSQASEMTALTNQVAAGNNKCDGGGGNRAQTGDKNLKEKYTCTECKLLVWQKEENCPEYEHNAEKCWAGWKSALK